MKKGNVLLICMLCCLFTAATAFAEEGTENAQDRTALDEIVVTAARTEEPAGEVNANVTILDEQEIEMSPARDLGELLAEENIGHIHKYPGSQTSVGIRGLRSSATGNDLAGRVLLLFNGRRAGTGNFTKIMTENIERIEIIRGPASVQYGSAALGGVINVITKQGSGEPDFFVKGALGSFGYDEAAAGFSGKAKNFDFSGSVSRNTMEDYDTADDEDYENTGYTEKENSSLNLGYEFLPGNRIGLIYSGYNADKVGSPNYLSQNDPNDYVNNSNESIDFIYDGKSRKGLFSWKARYFQGEDVYDYYSIPNPGSTDSSFVSETETDYEGAQAQVSWNPGQYTMTTGLDWVNYDIEQSNAPNKAEYDNPSWFIMGKARYFEDRLILSGGLRYDDYEVEVKEGQGGTEDDENVSPSLGVSYFLLDNLKLRASYGQGFRMPTAAELAGDYSTGMGMYETIYKGNPDLDPEKNDSYEIGLDWYQQVFDASLTYFYTDWEDKIEERPGEEAGSQTWKNIGDATISGFEGSFAFNVGNLMEWNWQIDPYINFTYLTEYEDDETHDDLKYTSDLLFSYGLSVSDSDGFSARINFTYTGEQDIDDHENGYFDPDTFEYVTPEVEKGGFTVASISVERRLMDFKDSGELTLNGAIQNLFDKDYAYVKGYPMPGRSFEMGLEYRY